MTLWVSLYLMTLHTQITHTHTHATNSRFVTSFYSDYWTEWVITRARWEEGGRAADWAETGQASLTERHWERNGDRETNRQRRGCCGVDGEGEGERRRGRRGGNMGVPRFMALTSASFSTRCSQPVCHAPLVTLHLLLLLSPSPPLVSCKSRKDGVGGVQNKSLFPGRCAVPGMRGHI